MGSSPSKKVHSVDPAPYLESVCGSGARAKYFNFHNKICDSVAKFRTSEQDLAPSESLVFEKECSTAFYRIKSGVLIASRSHFEQRRQVLGFYYPNDLIFPPPWKTTWPISIQALTKAHVEVFVFKSLGQAFWKRSDIGFGLFQLASGSGLRTLEQEGLLRQLTMEGRFATFLVGVARHLGQGNKNDLILSVPMTRIDIASYLGLRTETLSRLIFRWKQRGLISVRGRHVIVVHDFGKLKMLAHDRDGA